MTIGDALKQERLNMKLSQQEMAANIFSVANYSKIERNLQDIKAKDLFDLLKLHKIDFQKFAEKIGIELSIPSNNEIIKSDLSHQIMNAFYRRDVKKVIKINEDIQKQSSDEELKIRARLIVAIITNTVDKVNSQIESEVSNILFDNENWTTEIMTLRLFGNSMILFSDRHLLFAISEIIEKYDSKLDLYSTHVQYLIGTICINYLQNCYQRKIKRYVNDVFDILSQMPIHPQLLFIRILTDYYSALFKEDSLKITDVKNDLRKYGYEEYISNLPK